MRKLCIYCKKHPVFSHGYCRIHQHVRTGDKALGLKNITSKMNNIPKKKIKAKSKITFQLALFKEIWSERAHVSELSGDKISMFDVFCFHHILTKAAYPKFLLFKSNIIILTRAEHRMVHDHSFEDLIKKDIRWAEIERRYNILKTMYNNAE